MPQVSWSCKETGYGLGCILNLLTHSYVQLGSDGGSSPTVACPQRGFRYHHNEWGCKKAVLLSGAGAFGFMMWADAAYALSHPIPACSCLFHPQHLSPSAVIYQSSDNCRKKGIQSKMEMVRTWLFFQCWFCFSFALEFFCSTSRGTAG